MTWKAGSLRCFEWGYVSPHSQNEGYLSWDPHNKDYNMLGSKSIFRVSLFMETTVQAARPNPPKLTVNPL